MNYPIIIHKDKKSDYGVTVPDLPGCFSAGETLDEAIELSREAILLHVEGMIDDNKSIPDASDIEIIRNKFKDGIIAVVSVDLSELFGKAKRINISVPNRILNKVDRFAKKHGETRSGLLVNAAIEYISVHSNAREKMRPGR